NVCMSYEGIRYDDLSSKQQGVLRDLIGVYLHRLRPGHAKIRLAEAFDHLRDTHFSWIGAYDDHGPFYYRIYSPVVLIEFDHQPGIVYANDEPTRDHIHTVVRTPNGNDYGKDLLRQHYARHDHSQPRSEHRLGKEECEQAGAGYLIDLLMIFRFNTSTLRGFLRPPIRLSASGQRDRLLSSRWRTDTANRDPEVTHDGPSQLSGRPHGTSGARICHKSSIGRASRDTSSRAGNTDQHLRSALHDQLYDP